jgi:hypothetical protein
MSGSVGRVEGTTTVLKIATTLAFRTMANRGQRSSTVQSLGVPSLVFLGTLQSTTNRVLCAAQTVQHNVIEMVGAL